MDGKLKILIVGGNGFVGSSLTRAFANKFQVFSTYHRSYTPVKGAQYVRLPLLTDRERCERFIQSIEPDVVIYCLGSNIESEAEKDPKAANAIHSGGLTHLMYYTDLRKAKFIYISSDCVFSGIEGNFAENDSTIPNSQLGKAKIGGENMIKTRSLNHLIFRCAPLLGRGTLDHPSWLDIIRDKVIHSEKVRFNNRFLYNPVHISFLAMMIEKSLDLDLKNKVLHVGGLTKVSLFDLTKLFLEKIELSPELVESTDANSSSSTVDYSLNFTESLKSVEAKPLLLEQSLDLL